MSLFRQLRNITRGATRLPKSVQSRTIITSSISELQAAFRDPSSPFHIAPGTQGPESPDSPPTHAQFSTLAAEEAEVSQEELLEEAKQKLLAAGMDPQSFWEQRIVWGDQDSFQHVNNVRYIRFFESARIKWMMSMGTELGGPDRAKAMISGQGISLILKSIDVRFRRPVTYPDTLLVGYRPLPPAEPNHDSATFHVQASAYSLGQKAFVAHSKEALVWYDYDRLKKCDPGEEAKAVLLRRIVKS
ncbi:Thioesterase/thiol ester dehydrase-isomerase [Pholiota conissans]|uniref:Thioesterase/thiol ester dehydrase-isomerase n=1 Tax=Pholiota conissans TaxID=109636 RepID=A0A9P5ZD98_9AGAR|nr:Thioesterase/thiol ester dehydrase-isomerase [Pholiota conissans]